MSRIVITGAAGNLGSKLAADLAADFACVLIDRHATSDAIRAADLASWDDVWPRWFAGAEAVVHLAADSRAQAAWPDLVGPNIDAVLNVFEAARLAGVRRVVFASSNHVMGGYQGRCGPGELTTDLPPLPGAQYTVGAEQRDSRPYGATKLFGERVGRFYALQHGLEVVAVRIGWCRPGARNRWEDIPPDRGPWFRDMWLSDPDFCRLIRACLTAPLPEPFVVVNGMSANPGMPWDLAHTRDVVGFVPQDGVGR